MKDELQTLMTALDVAASDNPLAEQLLERARALDTLDETELGSLVRIAHASVDETSFRSGPEGDAARKLLALLNGEEDEETEDDESEVDEYEEEGL